MKKLLIIDEVPLFITGLATYLQQHLDMDIHRVDGFYEGLFQKVADVKPEFIVANISIGEQVNLELIKSLIKLLPSVKILAIANSRLNDVVLNIFKSGCKGLLYKTEKEEVYLQAIKTIVAGDDYYTPDAVKVILDHFAKGNPDNQKLKPVHQFSVRELEIIRLICMQLTAKEIGHELFISEKTVDFHRQKLVEKMGVRNMTGIIIYAIKNRIIDVADVPLLHAKEEKDVAVS